MLWRFILVLSFVLPPLIASEDLSPIEQKEIDDRIETFYSDSNAAAMNQKIPKFSLKQNRFVSPRPQFKTTKSADALTILAGKKAEDAYQKEYCEKFLKKHFPKINCDGHHDSEVQSNDQVEDLTDTWMDDVTYNLDRIPTSGKAAVTPWSDDYWRTRWGLTSYRYSEGKDYPTYREAVEAYAQPAVWENFISSGIKELAKEIVKWSPAEKYDLIVGDPKFTLTNEQKNEGQNSVDPEGKVEDWMGICHGWAIAAVMVNRPVKPVQLRGPEGVSVEFYPNDIKSLQSLLWANGNYETNFVGGRCNVKDPEVYPNGRLKQQDCFDSNPATFHLVLGNLLGRKKVGFVYDKTFDYEVWNQPVTSYSFTYFNPLNPTQRSKNWRDVAVPYDRNFKSKDRFQTPLTRGFKRNGRGPQARRPGDAKIRKIVGVITNVVYVSELSPPIHSAENQVDELVRETYTYDLELSEDRGKLIATGGEWHANLHPDFLWTSQKTSFASSDVDETKIHFDGINEPSAKVTKAAQKGSASANPLCEVVKVLTQKSSGMNYPCPND